MEQEQKQQNDKPNPESAKDDKSKSSKRIKYVLLSILGVAVVVTATVFIVLQIIGDGEVVLIDRPVPAERPAMPTGVQGNVVTMDNLDEVREAIARPPEDAQYNVIMSVDWTFERWDRPSRDAYVENSTRNTRTVFFDVFLTGTEELIYSSPYIPVGGNIENFALDTEVQAGRYTATVVYRLVDDDFEEITYLPVMIRLNILS